MKIKTIADKIISISRTARGKNMLTFIIFLVISTIFWFLMSLNDEVQQNYSISLELTDIPEDVTFLSTPPSTITVNVKDKGRALIRYDLGSTPKLRLGYKDFVKTSDNRLLISDQQLNNYIRDIFGSGTQVISTKPDSISLRYTSRPGDKLPVFLDIDAQTAPQFIIYDRPKIDIDSVVVYSSTGIPTSVLSISTERLSLRNLNDSITTEVSLIPPTGTRVIPSKVSVTIPVQPLIIKKKVLNVTTKNIPRHTNMLTFPASVEISYLLPMSLYSDDEFTPVASTDYNDAVSSSSGTIPVTISNIPDYYRNVTVKPERVEFIIEHHNTDIEHE